MHVGHQLHHGLEGGAGRGGGQPEDGEAAALHRAAEAVPLHPGVAGGEAGEGGLQRGVVVVAAELHLLHSEAQHQGQEGQQGDQRQGAGGHAGHSNSSLWVVWAW